MTATTDATFVRKEDEVKDGWLSCRKPRYPGWYVVQTIAMVGMTLLQVVARLNQRHNHRPWEFLLRIKLDFALFS